MTLKTLYYRGKNATKARLVRGAKKVSIAIGAEIETEMKLPSNLFKSKAKPTPSAGAKASFSGSVAVGTSGVNILANEAGIIGNSIVLSFNGEQTIAQTITAWNVANPTNTCHVSAGDDTQIPDADYSITLSNGADAKYAVFMGTVAGLATSVTVRATVAGATGNLIALPTNGTDTVSAIILAWNIANPGNQCELKDGDGNQIPDTGLTIQLINGVDQKAAGRVGSPGNNAELKITADHEGTAGNDILLEFDGTKTIATLISGWNSANPDNTCALISGVGTLKPLNLESIQLSGGEDPVVASKGVTPKADVKATAKATAQEKITALKAVAVKTQTKKVVTNKIVAKKKK